MLKSVMSNGGRGSRHIDIRACGQRTNDHSTCEASSFEYNRLIKLVNSLGIRGGPLFRKLVGFRTVGHLHFYHCEADIARLGVSAEESRRVLKSAAREVERILARESHEFGLEPLVNAVPASESSRPENKEDFEIKATAHIFSDAAEPKRRTREKVDAEGDRNTFESNYKALSTWLNNPKNA